MTIEELQAQRADINRQIRELRRKGEVSVDGARIARRTQYAYGEGEVWTLGLEVQGGRTARYISLFAGNTKEECVAAIHEIIEILQELYDAAK